MDVSKQSTATVNNPVPNEGSNTQGIDAAKDTKGATAQPLGYTRLEAPFLTIWAWRRHKDILTKGLLNQQMTKVFEE